MWCSRSTGAEVNTRNCVYASQRLANMDVPQLKMHWQSCVAWLVAGQMTISPRRSTVWVCQLAKAKPGLGIVCRQCAVFVESTPINPRRKVAHG
jgi:hypothetical protein